MVLFVYMIVSKSIPGWQSAGWSFFTSTNWNFSNGQYGALPLIAGTILTTLLALVVAVPIGVGTAVALAFFIPRRLRTPIGAIVEILAVVPSVIYGVWGLFVLVPILDQTIMPWLSSLTGGKWPFSPQGTGQSLLLGGVVLGVMILPTVAAISRDVLVAVPNELIEGSLSLGATKGRTLRSVVLPTAKTGIIGAVVLGTGRAMGETIAMVFLLGGVNQLHPIPTNLFATTATLASEIASNWGDLNGPIPIGIICCLALTLMVMVGLVTFSARGIIARAERRLR